MRVVILGTGTSQGIPVIGCTCPVCQSDDPRDRRRRVSAWLDDGHSKILIDIGPDFRAQMLDNGLTDVDAVLLTHEHNDHTAGIDDIRPINFAQQKSMPMYALPRVGNEVKRRFDYAFAEQKYPGAPRISIVNIDLTPFHVDSTRVIPIGVEHGRLPILGFRIGNFAYLTDVKRIPDSEMKKLENLEVLVISCLRREREHYSHLILPEAMEWIVRIGASQTYLTHLSHEMGLHADVEDQLPNHVKIAYDGLTIEL